ncbi:lipoprotein insertase outer membrane protein LolB [Vibrio genomosp. F10 str. 9ZC157]|uniref:Outer-membrane lipoprotein LolB n=1 Tax=Vibrio genomosp. F10 str. ZF-129 TaxID=1187848 RepID=A0A1E5BEJ8_9VIBR|nr:lipoprotein insertase outer membrane protein LolB [Vibrio genomosp. F10]OEE34007.1 lipoprotein localization factor LolB [Vibrio genomosp. F10 str. ZF-129]OEE97893.1 lipoprotein localization factor LolB [Vibrio genomosp. F10 str. 9ZC157]
MIIFRRLISFIFTVLLLAGCSTLPESQTSVEWQAHLDKLRSITQYKTIGKLGYISPEQRQSLNFQWKHTPVLEQLRLTTFIGQTVLNLSITESGSVVNTYDNQTLSHRSADVLIEQLTGLMIPIEQLEDWLLGNPTLADTYQLNDNNTLSTLQKTVGQQQWRLQFLSYQDVEYQGSVLPLPRKIRLIHQDTSINLVIANWIL